jgi:hypothetical protein
LEGVLSREAITPLLANPALLHTVRQLGNITWPKSPLEKLKKTFYICATSALAPIYIRRWLRARCSKNSRQISMCTRSTGKIYILATFAKRAPSMVLWEVLVRARPQLLFYISHLFHQTLYKNFVIPNTKIIFM